MQSIPHPPPAPGSGRFAARIAAHNYALSLPCPTDGLVYPPPRPTPSLVTLIGARLRREEEDRQQLERAAELYGPFPPDAKEVA
jgi:hypothetical protein